MKKLNLLLAVILLCTATTLARVDINETNFPCENFRAWLLQQSWGSKGYITDAEIDTIAVIDVSQRNISDLTGIHFFYNLRDLNCRRNQLTSLNLSGLTNLTTLNCSNNELTSLNVSELTNLELLWCYRNQLASLDVSALTNLIFLECSNNQLISLDVSDLINLRGLFAENNQLTSLDLLGLNNLVSLLVSNNQFTTLDVSGLTNLEFLFVENNQFTSLDVSELTNLLTLLCTSNKLTSLDLTGLNRLTTFLGGGQTPTLTLTGANDNYSLEVELNNPTNLVQGLEYFNGILTSTSNTITSSLFRVETIGRNFTLNGRLTLNYETETSIREIVNENRKPIAFYTITGIKLHTKPQSGIFIVLYDDGTSGKVMKR